MNDNMPNQQSKTAKVEPISSSAGLGVRRIAISVRQPWAWLILHAGKDIENRNWPTKFRGRVLIHASKGMTMQEWEDAYEFAKYRAGEKPIIIPGPDMLQKGGIVGELEIVDCVTQSASPWFFGKFGFVLRNAKPLPFQPCKGALGFFRANGHNAAISHIRDEKSKP